MMILSQKDIDRLLIRIDKNNSEIFYGGSRCWEWLGARTTSRYGHVSIFNKVVYVHRAMYAFFAGEIPNGMHVLHHCDNPPCCNPAHLFLGTDKDNSDDMGKKGRRNDAKGERHPKCKLSDAQVSEIRRRYVKYGVRGGDTCISLSKEFGVSSRHIIGLVRHENRK